MITNPSKALAKLGPRACSLWITFYCSELPNQQRIKEQCLILLQQNSGSFFVVVIAFINQPNKKQTNKQKKTRQSPMLQPKDSCIISKIQRSSLGASCFIQQLTQREFNPSTHFFHLVTSTLLPGLSWMRGSSVQGTQQATFSPMEQGNSRPE